MTQVSYSCIWTSLANMNKETTAGRQGYDSREEIARAGWVHVNYNAMVVKKNLDNCHYYLLGLRDNGEILLMIKLTKIKTLFDTEGFCIIARRSV